MLAIVLVGAVAAVGWYVWDSKNEANKSLDSASQQAIGATPQNKLLSYDSSYFPDGWNRYEPKYEDAVGEHLALFKGEKPQGNICFVTADQMFDTSAAAERAGTYAKEQYEKDKSFMEEYKKGYLQDYDIGKVKINTTEGDIELTSYYAINNPENRQAENTDTDWRITSFLVQDGYYIEFVVKCPSESLLTDSIPVINAIRVDLR